MSRKQKVYDAVRALEGPVPDQMTWRRIVQAAGYTACRDAAGFYGGVYPSMVLNGDGTRSLTAHGWGHAGSRAVVAGVASGCGARGSADMGELIKLEASHGRRYIVESGVLDDRARLAFMMGHCHSMALALRARLGGELMGLVDVQRPYDHILVALNEQTLVDVGGARHERAVMASGGKLVPLSRAELDELEAHGWMPARPDVAATFVPAIVACVDAGEPHRSPRCYSRDFVLGDAFEVHVEWSTADTGERLTAFGRPVDGRGGRWTRCAVMSIREDQNGERIIDFTSEAFAEHADRFAASLQSKLGHVVANVAAAENPQQPQCPPPE